MIETTAELAAACETLASGDYLTIDTEFLRETTFWPQLCLIQMAGPDIAVIVDPMAKDIDLAPFFALMANTDVVKVFHAARQDIEIIYNLGKLIPHPIFDTQVAAMVCGFGDSVSYDQLVSRIKNVHIDKSSRFTDWSRRPLSEKQLDYALADVTHLRDVYLHLKAELEREGRSLWLTEEMAILEAKETYDIHPDDAWQRLKMRLKKPIELAVLQKVAACANARRVTATFRVAVSSRMTASMKSPSSSQRTWKRCRACAPSPRAGNARPPAPRSSRRSTQHWNCPRPTCPSCRARTRPRKAPRPPAKCSRSC